MFLLKSLLGTRTPLYVPHKSLCLSSSNFLRSLTSSSPQTILETTKDDSSHKEKKPLYVLFEEAVGMRPRTENDGHGSQNHELNKRFIELEREVRELKEAKSSEGKRSLQRTKPEQFKKSEKIEDSKSLFSLFAGKGRKDQGNKMREEAGRILKELSPEMELFLKVLYREGHFNQANFLPGSRFDSGCFDNSYGRDYIKFSIEKFGKDHQEIAKWLSGSELKKVAFFGCPSLGRKTVFSAKRLRKFFEIQEDTVCNKCTLRESCKFVNQSVWKADTNNLNLADVLRIITLYASGLVPKELEVPDEIMVSVSKLLKEVIRLSETTTQGYLR